MDLLNGLVVLELSATTKAGYCGKLFREWGADVVKVERPDTEQPVKRKYWLDRGKSSVVLDWHVGDGSDLLKLLISRADIVVHDLGADECEVVDLLRAQQQANERLILVELSDLGHAGPFADRPSTDLIVSALSGMARVNGTVDNMPLREPGNQTALVAALAGFIGALAALCNRTAADKGQSVHVSALEAMVNVLSPTLLQQSYQGGVARRAAANGYLFEYADGQVSIIISSERSWQTIVEMWQLEVALDDPKLGSEGARRANMDAVRDLLHPVLLLKCRSEIFFELCLVRIPCGMLMSPSELRTDPHLLERHSMTSVRESNGKELVFPGPSFRLAGVEPTADERLHRRGEDTARLLVSKPTAGVRTA